jgi:hypothetical protein
VACDQAGAPCAVVLQLPGSDPRQQHELDAEYVVIRNGDNVSHSVSGWTVRDAVGHVYKFGTLRLGAGKQAIIHTGDSTSCTTLPVGTSTAVGNGMCGTTRATR